MQLVADDGGIVRLLRAQLLLLQSCLKPNALLLLVGHATEVLVCLDAQVLDLLQEHLVARLAVICLRDGLGRGVLEVGKGRLQVGVLVLELCELGAQVAHFALELRARACVVGMLTLLPLGRFALLGEQDGTLPLELVDARRLLGELRGALVGCERRFELCALRGVLVLLGLGEGAR